MDNIDRLLRHFIKIAELKSLSRAAETLELTQPGISRQLGALEEHLGKALFVRTGRGVEMTPAGEKLFATVKSAYAVIDEMLNVVRDREGVTEGQVRLAVIHTLSYYFMADVAAQFINRREKVNLSLMGRSSPEVVSLVESGKADLGLVYDSAVDTDVFASTALFDDVMCLIAFADNDLPAEIDLTGTDMRLVGFPPRYALRQMLQRSGFKPRIVAEAETVDAMLKLVSSRVGACVLPDRIPDRLLADYGLRKVRIARPRMCRRVVAIVPRDRATPPLVRELIDIARANVR